MLVSLKGNVKHLTSLFAILTDQLIAYLQKSGEASFNDFLELILTRVLVTLEAIGAASNEQALQTSQHGGWVVGVE